MYRGVAQWLARYVRDVEAGGSNPLTPTSISSTDMANAGEFTPTLTLPLGGGGGYFVYGWPLCAIIVLFPIPDVFCMEARLCRSEETTGSP